MTVSRKEIVPETTVDLNDFECKIDKELKKSETVENLKKYGVATISIYGANLDNITGLYEFTQKYTKLGWSVDYYSCNNVIIFIFE